MFGKINSRPDILDRKSNTLMVMISSKCNIDD